MSLPNLAKSFEDAVLAFVWRQWGQLGVSAHVRRPDRWCQDPEALLVFSLEVARREPRMFDEIIDWLHRNNASLMRQRIQNLLTRPGTPWDSSLVSASLESAGLQPLTKATRTLSDSTWRAVFEDPYAALALVEQPDEVFLRHGLRRPPFRASGKSVEPDLNAPINFAFRLRALFGPSTRAEAMRCLLLRPERQHGTAEVASFALLSRVGVHQALDAMTRAGVCERRQKGRKDLVWSVNEDQWMPWLRLATTERPEWIDWPPVLEGILLLRRWLVAAERQAESPYLRASRARELAESIAPLLHDHGLPELFILPDDLRGESYWPAFDLAVRALGIFLESGGFRKEEGVPPLTGVHPMFVRQFLLRSFPWISDVEIYAGPYRLYYRLSIDHEGPIRPDYDRARAAIEPFRLMTVSTDLGDQEPGDCLGPLAFPASDEKIFTRAKPTASGLVDSLNALFPKARFVRIEDNFVTKSLVLFQDPQGEAVVKDEVGRALRLLTPWAPFELEAIRRAEQAPA